MPDLDWTAKVDIDAIHAKRRRRARRDDERRKAWLEKQEKRRKLRAAQGLPPEITPGLHGPDSPAAAPAEDVTVNKATR